MRRLAYPASCVLPIVVVLGCTSCREVPVDEPYNKNLGDENDRLLPESSTVLFAHDASILEGQTRAEIARRGDDLSARQLATPPPASESTGSPTDRLLSAGSKFFGAIGGIFSGKSSTDKEASTSTGAGGEPTANRAGETSPAAQALIDKFDAAVKAGDIRSLPGLHVAAQRSAANDYYKMFDDLGKIVEVIQLDAESAEAGSGSKVTQRWNEYLRANLTIAPQDVTIDPQDGSAQINIALLGDPSDQNRLSAAFNKLDEDLNALENQLDDGSLSASAALAKLDQILSGTSLTLHP